MKMKIKSDCKINNNHNYPRPTKTTVDLAFITNYGEHTPCIYSITRRGRVSYQLFIVFEALHKYATVGARLADTSYSATKWRKWDANSDFITRNLFLIV